MKNIILGLSIALVAFTGMTASQSVEARNNGRNHRIIISAHDVIYIRGIPHHRHHRTPLHVVRDRRGYPISYYFVDTRRDRYDYRDDNRRHYRNDRYRHHGRDRHDRRDGITIIYRN